MVGPQDTYEAGPNGNEVLGPNPGTNILTTNHMRSHCLSSVTDCNGKWCGWYTYIGNKDRLHHCCMYLPFADVNLILRQHTYNMYGIFF